MAKFTFNIGDDYVLKLSKLGTTSEEIAKKAIYEGAKIVADEIKARTPKDSGDLADSLGITPMSRDDNGDWNAKVGFDGYDSRGVPNQLKARVAESGTSTQKKKPFVRPAVNATRKTAIKEMERIIDEEIKKLVK